MRFLVLATALAAVPMLSACTAHVAQNGTETSDPRLAKLDQEVYQMPVEALPALGGAQPLVTAIVFTDYGCSFCSRLEPTLAELRATYGDDVRIAIALRPLPVHEQGRAAAAAALAADAQGRFAAMHERLIALGGHLDAASITEAAKQAGLDMKRFDADRKSAAVEKKLAAIDELATRFSVEGVPSTFVNGRRLTGAQGDLLKQLVADRVEAARELMKSGVDRAAIYAKTVERGHDHAAREPSVTMTAKPQTQAVLGHMKDLAKCWPTETSPEIEITLDLGVRADGTVTSATATPKSAAASCVESVAKTWSLDRSESDTTLRVGFVKGNGLRINL